MKKDNLKSVLDSIEGWCAKNEIAIFHGQIFKNYLTQILWSLEYDGEWESYLKVLKNFDLKVLIIYIDKNEIDVNDETVLSYKNTLEPEDKLDYEKALSSLKEVNGHIFHFELYFIHDNVCYAYTQDAEWYENYLTISEAFDKQNEIDTDSKTLSDTQVEEFAREIILDIKYLNSKSSYEKRHLIRTFLEKENLSDYSGVGRIFIKAEQIIETEIKPEQEENIKGKILELKNKGLKKVEIASRLGINARTVNKYYYSDSN